MAEIERPVEVVQVDYLCDECGEPMERVGSMALHSIPPQFPHKCNNGHSRYFIGIEYPYHRYILKEPTHAQA